MVSGSKALRMPLFWLRMTALIFGIVAFAVIAEAAGYSKTNFAIFCGVTTMLLSIAFCAVYVQGAAEARGVLQTALALDMVYAIFWLACAASLSAWLADYGELDSWDWDEFEDLAASYSLGKNGKGRLGAAVAFGWLTWFVYIAIIVFDVLALKGSSPVMQGKADNAYPSASPAVPAGAPATRTYPPGGAAPAMPPGAIVGRDAVANAV